MVNFKTRNILYLFIQYIQNQHFLKLTLLETLVLDITVYYKFIAPFYTHAFFISQWLRLRQSGTLFSNDTVPAVYSEHALSIGNDGFQELCEDNLFWKYESKYKQSMEVQCST